MDKNALTKWKHISVSLQCARASFFTWIANKICLNFLPSCFLVHPMTTQLLRNGDKALEFACNNVMVSLLTQKINFGLGFSMEFRCFSCGIVVVVVILPISVCCCVCSYKVATAIRRCAILYYTVEHESSSCRLLGSVSVWFMFNMAIKLMYGLKCWQ